MAESDYTVSYEVPQDRQQVYDAVLDVRGWWSQRIEGATDRQAEFVFTVPGVHRTHARIEELNPGRTVTWRVLDNWLVFVPDEDEWAGTEIRFDIEPTAAGSRLTFTHVGLRPDLACYDSCSAGWATYALASLRNRITTGTGAPITPTDEVAIRASLGLTPEGAVL